MPARMSLTDSPHASTADADDMSSGSGASDRFSDAKDAAPTAAAPGSPAPAETAALPGAAEPSAAAAGEEAPPAAVADASVPDAVSSQPEVTAPASADAARPAEADDGRTVPVPARPKGTGIAALVKRFQAGASSSDQAAPEASSSKGKAVPEASAPASASEGAARHSSLASAGALPDDEPTDEDRPLSGVVEAASLDTLPPSKGAHSLLDPDETIANPFASESQSRAATPQPTAVKDVDDAAPRSDLEQDPARFSTTSDASPAWRESTSSAAPSDSFDPASALANRFSMISLGSAGPSRSSGDAWASSKRDTLQPAGMEASEAGLLARQAARISRDGKARQSIDPARFKEQFERMQAGQRASQGAGPAASDDAHAERGASGEATADAAYTHPASAPDGPPPEEALEDVVDWDFWGEVMANYQEVAHTRPQELSQAIQAGIPAALRGMMWQLMSSSKDEEQELIYAYYLKQTTPHEKAIRKDLARTFPELSYFKDKTTGSENMFNVVKAYSLYDEPVGYCQGMAFVVGPLLLNMPDEEAFSTLVRLMKSYDLRGHFIVGMPGLQLRLFQFDRLLEELLPLLHRHLVRQGIKSSMYASSWFMTLFAYRTPLDIIYRVLDAVFAEGIEALFRFALALMKKNEEHLLTLGFDEAVPILATRVFDVYLQAASDGDSPAQYRVNEFVRDAFQMRITPFQLDTYAAEFEEQVKAANAHRREVEALRLVNRNLAARVKSLEDELTSINAEHVELVKTVVMAKLAKEEMAEELVRYKMMYAEAALLADQQGEGAGRALHLDRSASSSSLSQR